MHALAQWNGGVIIISHDERFITTVAQEVCCSSWFGPTIADDVAVVVGVW